MALDSLLRSDFDVFLLFNYFAAKFELYCTLFWDMALT